jgi:hypothetical protein
MTPIDDFIKTEESKMSWLDKLIRNYPKIRPTKSIACSLTNFKLENEKIIRPSNWERFISIIILFFLGIVWLGLVKMLLDYKFPFGVFLFGFLLVTFMIFMLIRNSFFNKRYNYNITINKEAIAVDRQKIYWTEIADTYIMNRQEGRSTNYYLIISKKDKTIEKLDLLNIGISDRKLSTIIEYYKTKVD